MELKEKLQLLIKEKQITQNALAAMIKTGGGNVSHMLAGRSKPSFDLLRNLFTHFPDINPDWLLLDDPNMYRRSSAQTGSSIGPTSSNGADNVSADKNEKPAPNFDSLFPEDPRQNHSSHGVSGDSNLSPFPNSGQPFGSTDSGLITQNMRNTIPITRVVILYADGSFEQFCPKE